MSFLKDLRTIENNLSSKKAKEAFKRFCETYAVEQIIKREIYKEAQLAAGSDPNRKCDWCGGIGGQHFHICNTETDGAPYVWVVDIPRP